MSVFAKRLKDVRKIAGLSQEKLGVAAGIDEMSASARMNQYERGKHDPDYLTVMRIAKVLNVPESYFYTIEDQAAWLTVTFHRASPEGKEQILAAAMLQATPGLPELNLENADPQTAPRAPLPVYKSGRKK